MKKNAQFLLAKFVLFLSVFPLIAQAQPKLRNPRWKVQVLIYANIDFQFTDSLGQPHRFITSMTQQEKDTAVAAASKFLNVDVPALNGGSMVPVGKVTIVPRTLTKLAYTGGCPFGYWPDPVVTAPDRDGLAFDAAIVIFQERAYDQVTGQYVYIGCYGGLTWPMGTGQTYASFIFRIFSNDQRNIFKHEWGHSILFYYDSSGTAPKPAVNNHINTTDTRYVHCGSGAPYILTDDSDTFPIPNSIYYNQSGFTHDYYSGTTATPDQVNRCLGITPAAWASGGPVTRPILNPGDLDGDGKVDIGDLYSLMYFLNLPANPNDRKDLDYDGQITILDARILVTLCTKARCAR